MIRPTFAALVMIGACAMIAISACGDDDKPLYIGTWKLQGLPGGQPIAGYDSTITITEVDASIEEDFGGTCKVTMSALSYKPIVQGDVEMFEIVYPQIGDVLCSPSPCEAKLPSLTGGSASSLGMCPQTMPPSKVLPNFRFSVKDDQHLMVDVPYWRAALLGVIYKKVATPRSTSIRR